MEDYFCGALKLALEFEDQSERFYRTAAGKVKDKFAQKTLEFLADDEITHKRKINDFNQSLLREEAVDLESTCRSDLPARLSGFLDEIAAAKTKNISQNAKDIDIYETAIELEKTGYEAYTKAYKNEREDQRVKDFFKFLADQETIHYKLLAESKKYLEDPSYYFEDYGGWIFNQ